MTATQPMASRRSLGSAKLLLLLLLQVMTHGGPWHARRLAFGDAHMERLHGHLNAVFTSRTGAHPGPSPAQGAAATACVLEHMPTARLVVLSKDAAPAGESKL